VINGKGVRVFVIAEVLVCFVPLAGLLFAGFLFAPFAVLDMLAGNVLENVWFFLVVVCGVAGFIALFQVLRWLFGHQTGRMGRWWTVALMLLGLLPVVVALVASLFEVLSDWGGDWRRDWHMLPALAVPVLVTAHLAYLARQYLFTNPERRVKL
jgi:hypothetical protein